MCEYWIGAPQKHRQGIRIEDRWQRLDKIGLIKNNKTGYSFTAFPLRAKTFQYTLNVPMETNVEETDEFFYTLSILLIFFWNIGF